MVLVKRVCGNPHRHRGPTSPQRHEPHHQAIANYPCTLISEEPLFRTRWCNTVLHQVRTISKPGGNPPVPLSQKGKSPGEENFLTSQTAPDPSRPPGHRPTGVRGSALIWARFRQRLAQRPRLLHGERPPVSRVGEAEPSHRIRFILVMRARKARSVGNSGIACHRPTLQ